MAKVGKVTETHSGHVSITESHSENIRPFTRQRTHLLGVYVCREAGRRLKRRRRKGEGYLLPKGKPVKTRGVKEKYVGYLKLETTA